MEKFQLNNLQLTSIQVVTRILSTSMDELVEVHWLQIFKFTTTQMWFPTFWGKSSRNKGAD